MVASFILIKALTFHKVVASFRLILALTFHKVSALMSVKEATTIQKVVSVIWIPLVVSNLTFADEQISSVIYIDRDHHSIGIYTASDLTLMASVIVERKSWHSPIRKPLYHRNCDLSRI